MKLHDMHFHSLFPHGVTCVLHTREAVDRMQVELSRAGFGADKTVRLSGRAGLDWLDADGTRHGRMARAVRTIQRICSEGEEKLLNRLEMALRDGHHVLIIMTSGNPREREQVRAIARAHTKESLFYCGTLAVEEFQT